jgi:hypothetical protein
MAPAEQVESELVPPVVERIALGALTSTFPPELVDRVVEQTGRFEQRRRLLPARVVVYYVLALALFAGVAYEEVMRRLVEGLGWARPARRGRRTWPHWHVPGASALGEARARLGPEPLRVLFAQAARPLATPATRGAWYRDWRVLILDGTCLDVADTPVNEAAFGRPGSSRGEGKGAFPQVRVAGLVECGTHAVVDAAQGPYHSGETTLARRLARADGRLGAGMLLLADRLFFGADLWQVMAATGADLLWRAKTGRTAPKLPIDRVLGDGSWLSRIYAATDRAKRHPITVRVVEYALADPGRRTKADRYRLVTTILDPQQAPAHELAALYTQRWEVETALAELKTSQRGPKAVLRSKTPELVAQEVWAHLLVHYALRRLMHQTALDEDLDPDRLSFTRTLRVVGRQLIAQAAFSP